MGLASHFTDWRVDLLVHHRGTHLVAEGTEALQLHRVPLGQVALHHRRQRRQHRQDVGVAHRALLLDVLGQPLAVVLADANRADRPQTRQLRKFLSEKCHSSKYLII